MSRCTYRSVLTVCFVLVTFLTVGVAAGESGWPHWRGPTGNGISPDGRPPVEWSATKNVKWKVPVPGRGSASPVVFGGKVFVATAVPAESTSKGSRGESGARGRRGRGRSSGGGRGGSPNTVQQFMLLCFDRATGKMLWSKVAAEEKPHEGVHGSHGFASASPFTDGERVYAYFGSRGLFCYDLAGKEIWKKTDFGKMQCRMGFGEGSSPTLHGDAVIVPWDEEGPSYVIALDKKTGKTIWRTDREEPSSWGTPLVVTHKGKKQVVLTGEKCARGYDFATGKELWRCGGQTQRPVASPVAGHGLVFIGSGFRGNFIGAFRLDKQGDLEGTEGVVWTIDRNTPDVPSLLLSGPRLYFHAGRSGRITCIDAKTKKPFFVERLDGVRDVYASPVAANGKAYFTSRDGTTVVIDDAEAFKVVATNRLGEGVDATPAIAGREMFIRGEKHLFCITEN